MLMLPILEMTRTDIEETKGINITDASRSNPPIKKD
jgi:hypothetical protein